MASPTTSATRPASAEHRAAGLLDWGLLTIPGLIWGASYLFIAEALAALPPNGITFLRMIIGFATLALIPAARRPVQRSDRAGIFWLGLLWLAFPMSMFPFAEQHVSSALTGMLNGALPLLATVVASLVARRLPSQAVMVGLLVGLAGAVLMAVPGFEAGKSSAGGILMVLVALVAYAISISLARPLQQRNGALPVVWRAQAVALVLTAPLGAPALMQAHWSPRPLLAMLALGALGTAVANVVMAMAAGRVGATRAAATSFLIPVVALVLGVLVRGEQVAALSLLGGAICLAGAWLVRRATLKAS